MMYEILILIGLTLLPFLELRASIPYGMLATDLAWQVVFIVCVLSNILLGPIVYFFLDRIIHVFLKIRWIEKCWHKSVERTQRRIHKFMERFGWLGVALFIAVPLPGSGTYSGALGSYILGLGYRKFIIANIIGVLIAGILVTLIVMTGSQAFSIFVKFL
ncbi:small multi-drug export protein [Candidatus Woesearchaeota archaeon]|nr:small multi-drug export protein [Candidatus Woesearchaeota archaeon]